MFNQDRKFNASGFSPRPSNNVPEHISNASQDEDIGHDDWNPRPEVFAGFLERDAVLAVANVMRVLREATGPLLFRELKDCLIHSTDTIERALNAKRASGQVREEKGRFSLSNV